MDKKHSPHYYSAVVVINTNGEVLLGKRKEDGIWTTPAGGANAGEENPARTAVRELFEEAGIPADERFLQPVMQRMTGNGKICHVYLYVVGSGIMTTSKMDPDQEVKTWKWFSMDKIPDALREDMRRWDSVMAGYMKYHGITKSLIDTLEKGGKPAQVGEIRDFGGKQYQKMGNGDWKPYIHPEEKQLEAEQNKNKVVSLTDKLKQKVEEKKQVSASGQHLSDLETQAVVPNQQTRSEKPVFTNVDAALAHGYDAKDFREVGNFFYDRAQKMADNIAKLEATKQKVDPNFEKIKKINLRYSRAFLSQANRIDDRQAKTKASMKKSTVMMGHQDGAEINTADFAMESALAGTWLDRAQMLMNGYEYGETPRNLPMDKGDLYLVKVEEGLYSGMFKTYTSVEDGVLEDNAKVRIERMTLPALIQFCIAKEWILKDVTPEIQPEQAQNLMVKLEAPMPVEPIAPPAPETTLDKLLRLVEKLTN